MYKRQVSYIGCKDQDIKVNGREVINVNLADDNKVLSEVVVVGYGTQKKARFSCRERHSSTSDMMMPSRSTSALLISRLPTWAPLLRFHLIQIQMVML